MNELRASLLDKLTHRAPFRDLLDVILQYKNRGVSQRVAYDVLEDLWREKGCDNACPADSPDCEMLGQLMHRVWGYCSLADAIWSTPLSAKKVD
jgi:hypothetical protein